MVICTWDFLNWKANHHSALMICIRAVTSSTNGASAETLAVILRPSEETHNQGFPSNATVMISNTRTEIASMNNQLTGPKPGVYRH